MRTLKLSLTSLGLFSVTSNADCRHPNGNLQTDAYHAPCADVLNNPLNTMCCAINRPNPSEGYAKDGVTADVCLPNGLCKQVSRQDDKTPLKPVYFREECTIADWKSGKCLNVCLTNSVSENVMMTPCDGNANSTRWCCGDNMDCCTGDIGVETLAPTFLGMLASATLVLTPSTASITTSSTTVNPFTSGTTAPINSGGHTVLTSGAIAGISLGTFAGLAFIGVAAFFVARRRYSANSPPPIYIEEAPQIGAHDTTYAYEADGAEPQVSEVSAANAKDHDGRVRVHEM